MPTVISGSTLSALSTVSWGVTSLFANNEAGVWFDPSDMTTMFQDAAGTTPVTAMEQPVGLILDKSRGLILGSELVPTSYTGSAGGTWAISSTQITRNASSTSQASLTLQASIVVGRTYLVTFQVANFSGDEFVFRLGSTSGTFYRIAANGTYTFRAVGAGTQTTIVFSPYVGTSGEATITNISVKEIPGNHASQSTLPSRPVLSARYNLLTKTESFNDAAWAPQTSTILPNVTTAPNGTFTASKMVEQSGLPPDSRYGFQLYGNGTGVTTTQNATFTIHVKAAERSQIAVGGKWAVGVAMEAVIIDLTTNSVVGGAAVSPGNIGASLLSVVNLNDGWKRITVTIVNASQAQNIIGFVALASGNTVNYSGNGTSGIFIWGADLRPTNIGTNLPPYQRVNTATDYDSNGFPAYLKFDGTDDFLVTSTINPGGVNKAQIFSGMRRTAVTDSYQCFFETSSSTDDNNGVIAMFGESVAAGARIYGQSRGTIALQAYPSSGVFSNITTNVLTVQSDISAPTLSLRSNGISVALTTSSQGTGNYLAYPLYIGRRGGVTLPGNMQLYNLILRFSATNLETPFIQATEAYINSKTKAY